MFDGVRDLRKALSGLKEPRALLQQSAQYVRDRFLCDRIFISDTRGGTPLEVMLRSGGVSGDSAGAIARISDQGISVGSSRIDAPCIVADRSKTRLDPAFDTALNDRGIHSFALLPLLSRGRVVGYIELHFCTLFNRWRRREISFLEHVADILSWNLDSLQGTPSGQSALTATVNSELAIQTRRIEALYEMSRSLQIHLDPALVALRGIRALLRATNSDCGLAAFTDPTTGALEVVAAEGLSEEYVNSLASVINTRTLLKQAVESKEGVSIPNIQEDDRAAREMARREGLHASIVMPLMFEDLVLGAIAIFRRHEGEYTHADFDLVAAASSQICLVARQAEFYAAEKRNARSLAALYRLSHELSKHFTPKEVAEHAFPIIQEEVPCKRMWLGVVNESGTHIIGQAGFGPGMRRRIVQVQIERSLRHDFLDEAIEKKQPIVVRQGERVECSGLNMILRRLNPGTMIIMPLVSLGQLVGILIVEPEIPSVFFAQSKLPLLSSMASEIATVILARRFESRMADADKVRMTGLLASGVAHNFNNLLQAVMGQASLIEMQLSADSPLVKSARMIVDSASRGASLISHLLACTVQENQTRSEVDFSAMFRESRDFYRSIVGSSIELEIDTVGEIPKVSADYARMQQVLSNLLMNARDAIGDREEGRVRIVCQSVRVGSGEVDPDLFPGPYLRIDVTDNGQGMDLDRQSRCFEPFFSTKAQDQNGGVEEGSGLGLSSAYSILKQHGGLITVHSDQGKGTTFSIYVPTTPAVSGEAADVLAGAESGMDVLMFDLEETVSTSVHSIVESQGYRAFGVRRRNKALELLKQHSQRVRLLIVDVDRSDEEGLAFIRAIRGEFPVLRVVILSFDYRRWGRLLKDVKHVDLLQKPLSVWALDALLKNLIAGKGISTLDMQVESEVDLPDSGVPDTRPFSGTDLLDEEKE